MVLTPIHFDPIGYLRTNGLAKPVAGTVFGNGRNGKSSG